MKHAVKWMAIPLLLAGAMACLALLGSPPIAPASLPQPNEVPVAPATPTPTELSKAGQEAVNELSEAMNKANAELAEMFKQIEADLTVKHSSFGSKIR